MLPDEIANLPLDEAELSVRASDQLRSAGFTTLGEVLAQDPASLDARVALEIQALMDEVYEFEWGGTIVVPPLEVPAERAVPRLQIVLEPGCDPDAAIDRVGGRPLAPSSATDWPISDSGRPMQFMFQLIGQAGGGSLELGDVAVVQVFADLQGEYYEEGEHAVVVHREPCPVVLALPDGVAMLEPRAMRFVAGVDDRILADEWDDEREDEWNLAHQHGFCSKVWGVPVGGNLELPVEGADGTELRHVVQFVDIDDWFLWYLFANADLSETRLVIERG
ncbi:hypothetical protein ACNOYE_37610 [Nannocystaceae bacterium ST9]